MLSNAEIAVLDQMKHGLYLVRNKDGQEGLTSYQTITSMTKKGTIENLEKEGLIFESMNKNKWLLTDEGRKVKG